MYNNPIIDNDEFWPSEKSDEEIEDERLFWADFEYHREQDDKES